MPQGLGGIDLGHGDFSGPVAKLDGPEVEIRLEFILPEPRLIEVDPRILQHPACHGPEAVGGLRHPAPGDQ